MICFEADMPIKVNEMSSSSNPSIKFDQSERTGSESLTEEYVISSTIPFSV